MPEKMKCEMSVAEKVSVKNQSLVGEETQANRVRKMGLPCMVDG